MKKLMFAFITLLLIYTLFNLVPSSQNQITGLTLANGMECNSNNECSSYYCDLDAGPGVGFCAVYSPSTCHSSSQSECASSQYCVVYRSGDWCYASSEYGTYSCSDLEQQSECNKVANDCQWFNEACIEADAYICGNNIKEGLERCDGTDFGVESCEYWGYTGGTLTCTSSCSVDISTCTTDCSSHTQSQCSNYPQCISYAGDYCTDNTYISTSSECQYLINKKDCDKINLCEWDPNSNNCQADGIGYCGNNKVDSNEECDIVAFNSKTCATEGFTSGELRCNSDCTLITTQCSNHLSTQTEETINSEVVGLSVQELNEGLNPITNIEAVVEDITIDEINLPPAINIQRRIVEIRDQTFTQILNLNEAIIDPEQEQLTYELQYNEELIICKITNNLLLCKKTGNSIEENSKLTIIVSDGINTINTTIKIKIGTTILAELDDEAVAAGFFSENTAPVADAGLDQIIHKGRIIVLDASRSYDSDNNIPSSPTSYIWKLNDNVIAQGKISSYKIEEIGSYTIELEIKDSLGLNSKDSLVIHIIDKNKCKETNALYFPEDTICNKKWPSRDGEELFVNTQDFSCNLVEVCSEEIDPIIEDAIDCCDGSILIDQKKINACLYANKNSNSNSKRCQGLYFVQSLGANAVYMQDYFEAEMCCGGIDVLCNNPSNLYKAKPIPNTESPFNLQKDLRCGASSSDNNGQWVSDFDLTLNNIALTDVPSHVSLTKLSTGTCVDYSFSLTTLFRKAGYAESEVYTVEAPDHAFNIIRLPLDKKYTIVDTTGNNYAIKLGDVPYGYPYCENIRKCYNDNGEHPCPLLTEINGCEGVEENLLLQTSRTKAAVAKGVKGTSTSIINSVLEELGLR